MAVLLMKLRLVPDDELAAIEALLEQQGLEYYATTAGNWSISLPALWLVDADRIDEARTLLDDFAQQRQAQARALHEALRESGRARTMLDIARENPLRFVLYLAIVAALVAVSIVPFLQLN
jgi:Family of unknown function (DUF6164)